MGRKESNQTNQPYPTNNFCLEYIVCFLHLLHELKRKPSLQHIKKSFLILGGI